MDDDKLIKLSEIAAALECKDFGRAIKILSEAQADIEAETEQDYKTLAQPASSDEKFKLLEYLLSPKSQTVDEGRLERTSDEAPYRVDGKDSSTSIVEYVRNPPRTHWLLLSLGGTEHTLCGLYDSYTFTTNPDAVDCPKCLAMIRERLDKK